MENMWPFKVRRFMNERGISQHEMANKLGVNRSVISLYLTGRRQPPLEKLRKIAEILGVQLTDLINDSEQSSQMDGKSVKEEFRFSRKIRTIPLISWDKAIDYTSSIVLPEQTEYFPVPKLRCGPNAYVLTVQNDAMRAQNGEKSFLPGEKIIAEPDTKPGNGAFVIAKIEGQSEPTFKQYVLDGSQAYLKPLNMQYPTLPLTNDTKIIAVVVGHIDYGVSA